MTADEYERKATELATESAALREELRFYENLVHDKLNRDTEQHYARIRNAERHIHRIVERLVELEREQIDLNIAREL